MNIFTCGPNVPTQRSKRQKHRSQGEMQYFRRVVERDVCEAAVWEAGLGTDPKPSRPSPWPQEVGRTGARVLVQSHRTENGSVCQRGAGRAWKNSAKSQKDKARDPHTRCPVLGEHGEPVKSGQLTAFISKDIPREDQTLPTISSLPFSEHFQTFPLENSSRTCLGVKIAIILLNYLQPAEQSSKSNPPHITNICPHYRYFKACASCRLWRRIPRPPRYFNPLLQQLNILTAVQSKLFKEKALFVQSKFQ